MACARSAFYGKQDLSRAEELAMRAIALAPTSGEAHLAHGLAHMYASRIPEAARMVTRAVHHAPGLARAQALLGALLLEANSLDDAILHLEGAHALDPIGSQTADLPRAYYYAGRPDCDIDGLAAHLPPGHLGARILHSRFAMWRGQMLSIAPLPVGEVPESQRLYFEAIEALQRTRKATPEQLAIIETHTRTTNPRLRTTRAQFLVEFLIWLGDPTKAMEYLRLSVESGLQDYCWMLRCPMLPPLRAHPDWPALEAIVAARASEVTKSVRDTLDAVRAHA
jgi:tetratricopeptide (TPR) repeat protein